MKFKELLEVKKGQYTKVELYIGNFQSKEGLQCPHDISLIGNDDRIDEMEIVSAQYFIVKKGSYSVVGKNTYPIPKDDDLILLIIVPAKQYGAALYAPYTGKEYKMYRYYDKQYRAQRPCAICHSKVHPGALSAHNLKDHECLVKQCPFLEKCENHPYWTHLAKKKAGKKQKSEELNKLSGNVN